MWNERKLAELVEEVKARTERDNTMLAYLGKPIAIADPYLALSELMTCQVEGSVGAPVPTPGDRQIIEAPSFGNLPEYRAYQYYRSDGQWHTEERKEKDKLNRRVQCWDIVRCPSCSKLHKVPLPDRRKVKS